MKTTITIHNVGKKFFNYSLEEVDCEREDEYVRRMHIGVGKINQPIEIKFHDAKKTESEV